MGRERLVSEEWRFTSPTNRAYSRFSYSELESQAEGGRDLRCTCVATLLSAKVGELQIWVRKASPEVPLKGLLDPRNKRFKG
jgi:hypothetical protein